MNYRDKPLLPSECYQKLPDFLKNGRNNLIKSDWNLRECFKQLRFDKNHHLGLGDIRITIAQQDEICDLVERFYHCR